MVDLLVGGLDSAAIGSDEIVTPHLLDSEVTDVLRKLVLAGVLDEIQGAAAMTGFTELAITRFAADGLHLRMWELRHNVSAYDATYVALTEALGAASLLTIDARLANATGPRCRIELPDP